MRNVKAGIESGTLGSQMLCLHTKLRAVAPLYYHQVYINNDYIILFLISNA